MEKSQVFGNRGSRRWESRKKWFRRLRTDWNDHWEGWRPVYDFVDGKTRFIGPGDATQLCDCFDLTSKQAIRFKDTPRPCSCLGCGGNPRRLLDGRNSSNEGALTLTERVLNIGEREHWSKRKRREGRHPHRVICRRCGFLIKIVLVENRAWYRSEGLRCPGCDKSKV